MTRNDEIRKEILFQAYALRPIPVTADGIEKRCRKERLGFSLIEIKRELPFLVSERLLAEKETPGVAEKHYDITSDGVKHYENNYAE